MRALVFLLSSLAWAPVTGFAPVAAAQCDLSGLATVEGVRPRGTDLRFGIVEEARITLDGTRARVEGLRPVAFHGSAASRDVQLFSTRDRSLRGVVSVSAGTAVHVNRVRGDRAASFIDAGPIRIPLSLPCEQLALIPPTATGVEDEDLGNVVLVRQRSLVVYPGASSARGMRLALRAGASIAEWPWLTARGAAGTRIHVRTLLADGVVLDGWIERADVSYPSALSATCCDEMGGIAMCGHGFAGERYRGMARVAAETELRDSRGHVWGRVVSDSDAMVVVTSFGVTVTSAGGAPETHREETVWLEGIPGLVPGPCSPLNVQLDRSAVTLPSAD